MANILYGVSGEGSGHSSRAKVIGKHLIDKGHQVKIISYDRGFANLKGEFDVTAIEGLSIASKDNRVSMSKTLSANLRKLPGGLKSLSQLKALIKSFAPDCVITDFEPCSAYMAKKHKLPLIAIDNQHRMRYMNYSRPKGFKKDALMTEAVIKAMVPKPWVALTTTFHFGKSTSRRGYFFPPMIRDSVKAHTATTGEHILVYITTSFDSLLKILPSFAREKFIIYGADREDSQDNMTFKAFSEQGFLKDLSSAKAVIATAGFTLISEALHLAKPYLAFPMEGQFEQQLNAHMLEQLNYGARGTKPNKNTLAAFLYQLEDYRIALDKYPRQSNEGILNALDDLLADNMKKLMEYQR